MAGGKTGRKAGQFGRTDAAKAIQRVTPGLTLGGAQNALDGLLGAIAEALQDGKAVLLANFGSFSVRTREAHEARNPCTGEKIHVPTRCRILFKSSRMLNEAVNRQKA